MKQLVIQNFDHTVDPEPSSIVEIKPIVFSEVSQEISSSESLILSEISQEKIKNFMTDEVRTSLIIISIYSRLFLLF